MQMTKHAHTKGSRRTKKPHPARTSRRRAQGGMSLLEIMVSVFLFSMMGFLVSGIVIRSHNTKELLSNMNDRYHGVRVVLDRMSRELTMAFITQRVTTGDLSRITKTRFLGKDESPINTLTFTSFSHIRVVRNSKESDQNVVSYYGKAHPRKTGVYRLFRREKVVIDAKPSEGGLSDELLDNVTKLEIKYWDKQKRDWVVEWDTDKIERGSRLPTLIQIKLTVQDQNKKKVSFMTRVKVFMFEKFR